MKLWIPDIKDQLRLTENWEFPLFRERRNNSLTCRVNPRLEASYGRVEESIGCCLPKGTVLQVDRVYIRQGTSNAWSSVTFYIKHAPGDKDKPKFQKQTRYYGQPQPETSSGYYMNVDPAPQKLKGARFWAKLANVNEIECDPIADEDRVK